MKKGEKRNRIKKDKIKSNKRNSNKTIIIILIVIILTLTLLLILFKNASITTKVIERPYAPENCSNQSIKKVWEYIFKGSSENLTIIIPSEAYTILNQADPSGIFRINGCPIYEAYQINGTQVRMLRRAEIFFPGDNELIMASEMYLKPEKIQNFTSFLKNSSEGVGNYFLLMDKQELLSRDIINITEAKLNFESIFKIGSSNWTINLTEGDVYTFIENESMPNITLFGKSIDLEGNLAKSGFVNKNYSLSFYMYLASYDYGGVRYISKDMQNWTSPINTSINNINIKVNNSELNVLDFLLSKLWYFYEDLSGVQKIEIIQNNQTIIETEINFTEQSNFDWTKIILTKQSANSTKGYIIINGLNSSKKITVDRLSNKSESVCIKDNEINSINEITSGCSALDEYILNCPGNLNNNAGNLTCIISGNKFIITGLKHSAILEIIPLETPCIQNWQCGEWTEYPKECGYRNCTDSNNCGNITGKPIEQLECPEICIPDWKCSQFAPEKCPKDEKRKRTCSDLNDCGTDQDKPQLTETCERKSILIPILIIILGAGIIALIAIIFRRVIQKREKLKERPKAEKGHYRKDPNYPSPVEQYYGSDQTHNFKSPPKQKSNLEYQDGQERFPEKYWPK